MAAKQEIHDFAMRWFEKYRSNHSTEQEVSEGFADECFSLGFEMDCGKSFEKAFPDTNAFQDYQSLDKIIGQVDDSSLLTSAIFSKWRYITHWAYGENLLSPENRPWFILAFSRLAVLTSENGTSPFVFEGQAQTIQIVSNNIGCGPRPEPDEEIEQRLTVAADGRVRFSGYCCGQGGPYQLARTKDFNIGKESAAHILNMVGTYFSDEYDTVFAADIGSWEMTITNTDGKPYRFEGSLCCDFDADGVDLSDLLRDTLAMPDLFLFDGNCKPDKVDKITINYHRVTKIKPKVPISETVDTCTWDYSERLVLDRETETLEHIQRVGSGCVISRKYYVQEGVAGLLDDLEADSLFEHTIGNGPDVIADSNETKDYEITVDFHKRSQLVIHGTYDKNGLPEDWPEFAESVWNFIRFYGIGEILDPSVYGKARRKTGDYIFCSVEFNEGGKSYYYLTEDDTLSVGDLVLVPVGKDGHTAMVEIVNIEYFPEEKVPFPLDKVKSITRKCTDEDFDTPTEDDNQEAESIKSDKTIYALTEEPLKGTAPADIRLWLQSHTTEHNLAHAFSQVHNQTGWLMHDLDGAEDPELEKTYEEWWALETELCAAIIKILEKENSEDTESRKKAGKGTHNVVTPFMIRNGYKDGSGWWIRMDGKSEI